MSNAFGAKTNRQGYVSKFLPNPLSAFPSSSYYIRLSLIHPKDAESLNPPDERKLIIAETATTSRFYLEDVEVAQTVTWNGETRGTQGLLVNMTIKETLGITFLDYIIRGCQDLGIENHLNANYLLEIEFNVSQEDQALDSQAKSPYYFVYPLVFDNNMIININESGATYNIRATIVDFQAMKHLAADIPNNIELTGKNLGEALGALQNALNDFQTDEKNQNSLGVPDQYEIKTTDKKWYSFEFDNLRDPQVNPKVGRTLAPGDKMYLTFAKGSTVPDIIHAILAKTVDVSKLPTVSGKSAIINDKGESIKNLAEIKSFYKIRPLVTIIDWDVIRGDYARKYEFIIDTDFQTPQLYDSEELKTLNNKTAIQGRVQVLLEQQLLKKRYDYYYTGLNTEVLRFDVTLNNTWHQIKPIRGGNQEDRLSLKGSKFSGDPLLNSDAGFDFIMPGKGTTSEEWAARPEAIKNAILKEAQSREQNSNLRASNNYYLEWYGSADVKNDLNYYPVRTSKGTPIPDVKFGGLPGKTSGIAKFGAVFANLTDTADLMNIDIDIKGDPFWLGMSYLTKQYRNSAARGLAEFALYDKGSNMFWLNINTPSEPNEVTGEMEFSDVPSISGLYVVDKVIHSFSRGSFTQNLSARRDTGTNYNLAKAELKKSLESSRDTNDSKSPKSDVNYTDEELRQINEYD